MSKPHQIDVKHLLENYSANFDTGFIFKITDGEPIGSIYYNGSTRYRVYSRINGITYPNHRLLWAMWNECDVPVGFDIKHINKNQMDNRLINLSAASRTGSLKHRKSYREEIWKLIDEAEELAGSPLPYKNVENYRKVLAGAE